MGFQLSAGVNVSEIDLTTIVPSVATSIGGIAGKFAWGPVNQIVTISDEVRLVDRFGRPNNDNAEYWFSAANFLAYSNTLKVVRAANTSSTLNATSEGTGVLIENEDDYEANHSSGDNTFGEWAAKWPGVLGNSLRVELVDSASFSGWNYEGVFTGAPGTSDFVEAAGGSNDELHIVVIDENGRFTGTANTVLESFSFVSKASDSKTFDGSTNYYKNVINNRSRYIWWLSHTASVDTENWGLNSTNSFADTTGVVSTSLSGGALGTISNGDIIRAYDSFINADAVDVNLMISGPANATIANYLIDNIAEVRKDCLIFISPEKSDVVDNYGDEADDCVSFRNTLTSSSYGVMDSNWKYQFDKYNDIYRWIPLNGDIAGLCARTDQDRDPWYSPGGLNRGIIKNVVKLAWNPNKTDRDTLYVKGINPVVTFAGEGTILFGDKTLLSRPSAFDRINVRRLFIVLEKAIARAARSSLFEFNDTFTRAQFVNLVEPFLRDVQGRRGIFDFRVVCDETNNTGEVIDRNEFIGDIYIKPARSINFIQLNFVAVRTGVSFDEVVGKFG
jgi:phage tail sheath protein FI